MAPRAPFLTARFGGYYHRGVSQEDAELTHIGPGTPCGGYFQRFFQNAIRAKHTATPRIITVDKNAAYPPAFEALQQERALPESCTLRHCKCLNNVVEQDHRFLKRRMNSGLGFGSFRTVRRTPRGYEAMPMIQRSQIKGVAKGDVLAKN